MRRGAIWIISLAALGSSLAAMHGITAIILLIAWTVVFLGSVVFGMWSLSKFYCSTVWAKDHGYSHKTFRFFAWPRSK